jgi:hypothetical protein
VSAARVVLAFVSLGLPFEVSNRNRSKTTRRFIEAFRGAAAWPITARTQQPAVQVNCSIASRLRPSVKNQQFPTVEAGEREGPARQ